jgi:hypothetical protein
LEGARARGDRCFLAVAIDPQQRPGLIHDAARGKPVPDNATAARPWAPFADPSQCRASPSLPGDAHRRHGQRDAVVPVPRWPVSHIGRRWHLEKDPNAPVFATDDRAPPVLALRQREQRHRHRGSSCGRGPFLRRSVEFHENSRRSPLADTRESLGP